MTEPPKESRLQRRIKKREVRESVISDQRATFRKRERNKKIFNYVIIAAIILAVGYAVYISTAEEEGQFDALAQCLTGKGVVMYGTDWCSHCQEQKRMFGDSFRHVTFINCDLQADACKVAGVEGYPTWTFPRGDPTSGVQTLETLATRADCPLR